MRQSVIVGGSLSPPLGIKRGAPQGSILGYLMYILYANDIPDPQAPSININMTLKTLLS